MSKERDVAEQILQHIGGKENVVSAEHCATRLRLILKDDSRFDKKQIEAIDGVKGSFKAAGQHQIILGTGFVDKVYAQFMEIANFQEGELKTKAEATAGNMNWFQKASRLLGDVFLPIIPILVATGLFMGVRSLITNLGVTLDPTALTLSQVLIDTAFAFLPALVTYSVMKKFGGSPALGIVIGLMLVAPQLPNANQVAAGNVEPIYLSLGALSVPIVGYQGSVLPALVLGIIAVVFWFFGYSSILSVILGIVGLIQASKAKELGYLDAIRTAGFVLSLIGLIGGALAFVACVACVSCAGIASTLPL